MCFSIMLDQFCRLGLAGIVQLRKAFWKPRLVVVVRIPISTFFSLLSFYIINFSLVLQTMRIPFQFLFSQEHRQTFYLHSPKHKISTEPRQRKLVLLQGKSYTDYLLALKWLINWSQFKSISMKQALFFLW